MLLTLQYLCTQVVNSSLVNVRYSFNQIRGPFPAALAQAPQLTFLVINNNTARCQSCTYCHVLTVA